MKYIKRTIEPVLLNYLKVFPVIGLTGPRQSGKSTMLLRILESTHRYVTFDDINVLEHFHQDPKDFMEVYSENVIFDEVQYAPELFRYIKIAVDKNRSKKGNFVITGSSQFSFMKGVSESLAGRIGLLTLLPFGYNELNKKYRSKAVYNGGYPELSALKYNNTRAWFTSYVKTYLERDVRSLSNIGNIREFSIFLKLTASVSAQILDLTELSNKTDVSVNTIKKWISILEASYIVFLVGPYYKNFGKRLVKRPKLYFYDTGLLSFLLGIDSKIEYQKTTFSGSIFENYVVSEIKKEGKNSGERDELYYLRSSGGKEIDLISNYNSVVNFYEIKKSSTFRHNMITTLKEIKPEDQKGYLLYTGKSLKFKENIEVMNYGDYLEGMK